METKISYMKKSMHKTTTMVQLQNQNKLLKKKKLLLQEGDQHERVGPHLTYLTMNVVM